MNNIARKAGWIIAAVLALLVVAALAGVARGGPLDPPGPPASTLPQVEPRAPISSLPFTITQSGSYFLTQNLTANTGGDGITVLADNVTIDLNGFALTGVAGSASAISEGGSAPPHSGWVVKNGAIENWPNGSGVFGSHVTGGRYEDLHIKAAGHEGINAGNQSNLERVTVEGDGNYGLVVGPSSRVSDCSIKRTTAGGFYGVYLDAGSSLTRCSVEMYVDGIVALAQTEIEGCVLRSGSFGVYALGPSIVRGCAASGYTGAGIVMGDAGHALDNKVDSSAIGVQIRGSGVLVEGSVITNLTAQWLDVASGTGNIAIHNRIHMAKGATSCGTCELAVPPLESTTPPTFNGTNPNANIVY
jgi:hypothetical protein